MDAHPIAAIFPLMTNTNEGVPMTQQHIYSLNDVAALVGVKPHRIEYALKNGYLPEPAERVTNRRIFTTTDLQAAMIYFAKPASAVYPSRPICHAFIPVLPILAINFLPR
jgi:hypothetical protein